MAASLRVGVLSLQGGFKEHLSHLRRQPGVEAVDVRTEKELRTVDALILPGGESTSIGCSIVNAGLLEPLRAFAKTKPIWGVCAGMILLAEKFEMTSMAPSQPTIGGIDIVVHRNYFGRQADSRFRSMELVGEASKQGLSSKSHFIRAPAVTSVGAGVTPLATVDQVTVAVRKGSLLATCFHPEISNDESWLRFFLAEVCGHAAAHTAPASALPDPDIVAPWIAPPSDTDIGANDAVKRSFMVFQQGGVIMDVVNAAQARVAEEAGAVSVMALERIPADIKADGGIARMSDPKMIREIMDAVTLPVMAKARIGHFAEAQILDAMEVDCIDESEVLTTADELHHIDKHAFRVPFVCGAKNLGEALRRIAEGASMIRLKGNAGTGNVLEAVRHARSVFSEIRQLSSLAPEEVYVFAKEHQVPIHLVQQVRSAGRLPVVTFAAGGLATPADVALLMQLGCDGVFVGSGIFKGENPAQRAKAMVEACSHYRDAKRVARVSEGLGKGMVGILDNGEKYALTANFDSKL
eukprot:gnl/TRDRNA2_/TRDRNA2_29919_c0_seq1.p1 gnl/TRDRNA2_/TRDRNA2_29919_c0~~gnl/TRDRNA2_/TRDRNA2_29919_c0_seq1.p1  ORF type:complete len:523 (+),score=120.86 gnl/TRDRNA2_/TRDRNA2_29919_c0_seq1:73-1641(+)